MNRPTITISVRYVYDPAPLRVAMKEQHVTGQQLALEYGCTDVTISRVLKGRNASLEILQWLCERLNVAESVVIKQEASPTKKFE